jgi:hypothetical protein
MNNIARKLLFLRLSKIKIGLLTLHDAHESWNFGDEGASPELSAVIRVTSPSFYFISMMKGSLGAADGD